MERKDRGRKRQTKKGTSRLKQGGDEGSSREEDEDWMSQREKALGKEKKKGRGR